MSRTKSFWTCFFSPPCLEFVLTAEHENIKSRRWRETFAYAVCVCVCGVLMLRVQLYKYTHTHTQLFVICFLIHTASLFSSLFYAMPFFSRVCVRARAPDWQTVEGTCGRWLLERRVVVEVKVLHVCVYARAQLNYGLLWLW